MKRSFSVILQNFRWNSGTWDDSFHLWWIVNTMVAKFPEQYRLFPIDQTIGWSHHETAGWSETCIRVVDLPKPMSKT
jgi:hypothetical protein